MRKPVSKKSATKAKKKSAKIDHAAVDARRASYSRMEPHVCDLARAAELAMLASDDASLFLFAVEQFETMAQQFRKRYYAEDFLREKEYDARWAR